MFPPIQNTPVRPSFAGDYSKSADNGNPDPDWEAIWQFPELLQEPDDLPPSENGDTFSPGKPEPPQPSGIRTFLQKKIALPLPTLLISGLLSSAGGFALGATQPFSPAAITPPAVNTSSVQELESPDGQVPLPGFTPEHGENTAPAIDEPAINTSDVPDNTPETSSVVRTAPAGTLTQNSFTWTEDEVKIWRERYESRSHGNWNQIEKRLNQFNPEPIHISDGPAALGPDIGDQQISEHQKRTEDGHAMNTAALMALITNDTELADKVKQKILAQTEHPSSQFDDASTWPPGVSVDRGPTWRIGSWVTHHLVAKSYLDTRAELAGEPAPFSAEEEAKFHKWLEEYARVAMADTKDPDEYPGEDHSTLPRWFNNRRAAMVKPIGLIGIETGNEEFIDFAKRWTMRFVDVSVTPEGYILSEGDRREQLFNYTTNTVGSLLTFAEALARHGDSSLMDYKSPNGGTLEGAVRSVAKGGPVIDRAGVEQVEGEWVEDGTRQRSSNAHRILVMHGARYYDYDVDGSVPDNPETVGRHPVTEGENGQYADVLWLFDDIPPESAPYR